MTRRLCSGWQTSLASVHKRGLFNSRTWVNYRLDRERRVQSRTCATPLACGCSGASVAKDGEERSVLTVEARPMGGGQ